jgi:protein arginine N-methyltransferase 1
MYSLAGYASMLRDRIRVDAYAQALRSVVQPESVVIDLGTGPGIFAILACQLGAKKVYALESSHIIQVAKDAAVDNGCSDKIEFIQDLSTRIDLPELGDVIVSDLRGVLPLFQQHIPTIIDARCRFLSRGGIIIPGRDTLWVAVVEAPQLYERFIDCWQNNSLEQDLRAARKLAINDPQSVWKSSVKLLTYPQCWAVLDYSTLEHPDVSGIFSDRVRRVGVGHGLMVWFDTHLVERFGFSNAPDAPESIYGSVFFPWPQPIALRESQMFRGRLDARLIGNDYLWSWTTEVESASNPANSSTRFEQSQIQSLPISLRRLHKARSDYIPQLNSEGRIRSRAFELMDGTKSLEAIAQVLASEFPQRFPRWQEALTFAGQLAQEYSG